MDEVKRGREFFNRLLFDATNWRTANKPKQATARWQFTSYPIEDLFEFLEYVCILEERNTALEAKAARGERIEAAARKYIADFWYLPNRKTIETEDPNLFDLVDALGLWGGDE